MSDLRFTLVLATALLGCAEPPAGKETYAGEPVRKAIVAGCTPALVDEVSGRACVQIDVFAEGQGPQAQAGDWIKLHYIVVLPNGTQVDSSHDRKPLAVQLDRSHDVIDGMHIGLAGVRAGERRRFVVPPKLGYRGAASAGVPPDADLTFLVEIVEVKSSP
jgi:peptidylprolyl isomerase